MPVPRLYEDLIQDNLFFNTQLKLILEKYGVYHSETGNRIDELLKQGLMREGKILIFGQEHPYVYDKDLSLPRLNKLLNEKRRLYEQYQTLVQHGPVSGFFAESIVFLALAKTLEMHKDSLNIHLLQPEMRWMNGKAYKIEFPLTIEGKFSP